MELIVINHDLLDPILYEQFKTLLMSTGQIINTSHIDEVAKIWFIYFIEGELVSFNCLKQSSKDNYKYEVGYVYTMEKHRRKGLAEKLLKENINTIDYIEDPFYLTTTSDAMNVLLAKLKFSIVDEWESIVNEEKTVYMWSQ